MLFRIKTYLSYLLKSTANDGIHSPFIKNFIHQIKSKKHKQKYKLHHTIRAELLINKSIIEVTDFGAGSQVFKNNSRPINKITKNAGINIRYSRLLINITSYLKPKTILEIGTSVGLATAALHIGNPQSNITTLEGCPTTLKVATDLFKQFSFKNIVTISGEFNDTLKNIDSIFDLIYFDGNHQEKATLEYFEHCLKLKNNNSIFIFDDINWSQGMENAWKKIKNHPEVTTTIDTFQWGIVFFKKEFQKEHFVLKV